MAASLLPDIRAQLVERFVFNFCLAPELLAAHLPSWLLPQVRNGYAPAAFCILDLNELTFGPIPKQLGLRNLNCAHRFGVTDALTGEPAVYVDERNTDSRLGAFITSLGFPGRHTHVQARITRDAGAWAITVRDDADAPLFAARVRPAQEFNSTMFASLDEFAGFMAAGVRSYCPAVRPGMLNVVDLHKADAAFEPLAVEHVEDRLFSEWMGAPGPIPIDSALRTTGGAYTWRYCGQQPTVRSS